MFGLLESCKLNKVNFGEYIEDIEDGTDAEVTKTSQAVAWLLDFRTQNFIQKYWYG